MEGSRSYAATVTERMVSVQKQCNEIGIEKGKLKKHKNILERNEKITKLTLLGERMRNDNLRSIVYRAMHLSTRKFGTSPGKVVDGVLKVLTNDIIFYTGGKMQRES